MTNSVTTTGNTTTTETNFKFGNLSVRRIRIESPNMLIRQLEVMRHTEECVEILSPSDPDHTQAIIWAINEENA